MRRAAVAIRPRPNAARRERSNACDTHVTDGRTAARSCPTSPIDRASHQGRDALLRRECSRRSSYCMSASTADERDWPAGTPRSTRCGALSVTRLIALRKLHLFGRRASQVWSIPSRPGRQFGPMACILPRRLGRRHTACGFAVARDAGRSLNSLLQRGDAVLERRTARVARPARGRHARDATDSSDPSGGRCRCGPGTLERAGLPP